MPPTPTYEIEIKSLLEGGPDQAQQLKQQLHDRFADLTQVENSQQLNHYFQGAALPQLVNRLASHLSPEQQTELRQLADTARDYSVRTRQIQDEQHPEPVVILVVKASIDDTTSQNGIARREFEAELSDLNIDQLDQEILAAGFEYQAKWSRDRQAFHSPDQQLTVSLDRNAGYGHLAEFEKVVTSEAEAAAAADDLRSLMAELGVAELPQDRLERMFQHYNQHWADYYGTDKTFSVQ